MITYIHTFLEKNVLVQWKKYYDLGKKKKCTAACLVALNVKI